MKSVSYPLISDVCALVIGVLLVWCKGGETMRVKVRSV